MALPLSRAASLRTLLCFVLRPQLRVPLGTAPGTPGLARARTSRLRRLRCGRVYAPPLPSALPSPRSRAARTGTARKPAPLPSVRVLSRLGPRASGPTPDRFQAPHVKPTRSAVTGSGSRPHHSRRSNRNPTLRPPSCRGSRPSRYQIKHLTTVITYVIISYNP